MTGLPSGGLRGTVFYLAFNFDANPYLVGLRRDGNIQSVVFWVGDFVQSNGMEATQLRTGSLNQPKMHVFFAHIAAREAFAAEQGDFMRNAMRAVKCSINAGIRYQFPARKEVPMLDLRHQVKTLPQLQFSPFEHDTSPYRIFDER